MAGMTADATDWPTVPWKVVCSAGGLAETLAVKVLRLAVCSVVCSVLDWVPQLAVAKEIQYAARSAVRTVV